MSCLTPPSSLGLPVVHPHASDVSPGECLFIPASMLAQGGVGAPDVQSENAPVVIPPDDILHVAATPSTIGRPTSSSATVVPPDARHDCRVAGCCPNKFSVRSQWHFGKSGLITQYTVPGVLTVPASTIRRLTGSGLAFVPRYWVAGIKTLTNEFDPELNSASNAFF